MFRMVFIPCVIDRSMSCTLDGSDAFASLKPYLGKEETIKIEATETGIRFDSKDFVKLSDEGCDGGDIAPSSTNWVLIVSVIVIVILLVIIVVVCIVKKRSKTLPKSTTPSSIC